MEGKKTLAARLLDVRRSIKWIQKDGHNPHQRFSYASSSGVLGSIKEAMDAEGVLLVPSVVRVERSERTTKSGGMEILTEIWLEYRVINAADPAEQYTIGWYGQGLDTGERGVGKALTYAEKYLILKLFQLPTDDSDPDADDRPADAPPPKPAHVPPPAHAPAPVHKDEAPAAENPNAASDKQKKMAWALVSKLMGDATKDEVKAALEEAAMRVAGKRLSELDKRSISALIEWLQNARLEDLHDDIGF